MTEELVTLRLQFVVVCKSGNAVECITNMVVTINLMKSCLILEWTTSMSGIKKVHKYLVEGDIWKVDDNCGHCHHLSFERSWALKATNGEVPSPQSNVKEVCIMMSGFISD